ncbi:MAG TPA: QueG-associated DUF1730 domain-containing protein, partial [Armatimonadaceae bacterium]|nr:QueG-associated DUF1730 domain-containing protein [Armatimonadaceae bacterium]
MSFSDPEHTPEARLRAKAAALGFDAVRFTTPDPPGHGAHVAAWLAAGMHGAMGYLENRAELREAPLSDPRLLDGARSVVVLAVSYTPPAGQIPPHAQPPRGTVARYARGDDYHDVLRGMLNELGAWVEAEWPGERARGFVDSGPIRERELAARAGLGWQGKHTNLISLDLGNFFF